MGVVVVHVAVRGAGPAAGRQDGQRRQRGVVRLHPVLGHQPDVVAAEVEAAQLHPLRVAVVRVLVILVVAAHRHAHAAADDHLPLLAAVVQAQHNVGLVALVIDVVFVQERLRDVVQGVVGIVGRTTP